MCSPFFKRGENSQKLHMPPADGRRGKENGQQGSNPILKRITESRKINLEKGILYGICRTKRCKKDLSDG